LAHAAGRLDFSKGRADALPFPGAPGTSP
jgi:hypothetical protein